MAEQGSNSSGADAPARGPLQHPWLIAGLLLVITALFFIPSQKKPDIDPAISQLLDRLAAAAAAIDADEARLIELRRSDDRPAIADEADALEARIRARREIAARLWQDLAAQMEISPPFHHSNHLVRFPSQPMQQWNYDQIYHPIEGPQPGKMAAGFSFDFHKIIPQTDGSLLHRLDESRGSAIKWERELRRGRTQGHYFVEATINEVRPGVVYAPLWLYSEGAKEPEHEFDFEYTNGRLEYNLHNGRGGFRMRAVEKDLSEHRVRYEIIRRPGEVTMRATSLTDGWTDDLVITPELVAGWAELPEAPPDLQFPPDHIPMFPLTELWRCNSPHWCGEWKPLPPNQYVEMVIHGYRFDP